MKKYIFESTIRCSSCLEKVTPLLTQFDGIQSWQVDLQVPQRYLTIEAEELDVARLTEALSQIGYTITETKG